MFKGINKIRFILLGVIGAFIIVIATIIYINATLTNYVKAPKNLVKISRNIPDLRLENVHYEKTRKGKTEWEIDARVARHYQGKDLLTLDSVKMVYYGSPERTVIIIGKQGRIKPSTKDVELLGDVLIKSSDGYQLKTNSLKYHSKSSLITTNDQVTIVGKSFRIHGVGMKLSIRNDRLSILHAVQTTLKGKFVKGGLPNLGL